MSRRIILTGPSSSGKSTVAELVARELGLALVSMDSFRCKLRHGAYVQHNGKRVRNYEDPVNWDANAVCGKLQALVREGLGFVAEGNHLLAYPGIAAIPGIETFYLDVSHAVSLERRKTRNRGTSPDLSFALIGEEQTKRFVVPQKETPGILVIDGTQTPAIISTLILLGDI